MSTLTVPYVYTIDRKIRLWRDSQTQTHTERQRDGETERESGDWTTLVDQGYEI